MEFTLDVSSLASLSWVIRISSLGYITSTNSYVRIYKLFMQNKPNFPYFSPENEDCAEKQTQFKPKQSQFWLITEGNKAKTNPNKANFTYPKFELVFHLIYGNVLINWIKSQQLFKRVQNCPYQYKKHAFIAVRIPLYAEFLSTREEILSCRLIVAHLSKAQ